MYYCLQTLKIKNIFYDYRRRKLISEFPERNNAIDLFQIQITYLLYKYTIFLQIDSSYNLNLDANSDESRVFSLETLKRQYDYHNLSHINGYLLHNGLLQ